MSDRKPGIFRTDMNTDGKQTVWELKEVNSDFPTTCHTCSEIIEDGSIEVMLTVRLHNSWLAPWVRWLHLECPKTHKDAIEAAKVIDQIERDDRLYRIEEMVKDVRAALERQERGHTIRKSLQGSFAGTTLPTTCHHCKKAVGDGEAWGSYGPSVVEKRPYHVKCWIDVPEGGLMSPKNLSTLVKQLIPALLGNLKEKP